jgi:hypothetical protein
VFYIFKKKFGCLYFKWKLNVILNPPLSTEIPLVDCVETTLHLRNRAEAWVRSFEVMIGRNVTWKQETEMGKALENVKLDAKWAGISKPKLLSQSTDRGGG